MMAGTAFGLTFFLLCIVMVTFANEVKRKKCSFTRNDTEQYQDPKMFLENPQILFYQLNGLNDTVYYTWSLVGAPTLFISVTPASQNTNCTEVANNSFDWEEFIADQSNGSAYIPGYNGSFAFSVVFNRLIEFSDRKYRANKGFKPSELNNTDRYRWLYMSDFNWTFQNNELTGTIENDSTTCVIRLNIPTSGGRLSYFPKTLYSENSTTFDFVFRNFEYSNISRNKKDSNLKYGRLVLEMLFVHGQLKNGSVKERFSKDDEYTPSVFITNNYLFGGNGTFDGFLQWKPISYLSGSRKSTQSQQANLINGEIGDVDIPPSLAYALYGSENAGIVQPVYMVYGTGGDDNNPNADYVSWTGMLGFGEPPQDTISIVVIITIAVGLGVPALLIGLGGVYIFIRRKPWKHVYVWYNTKRGYTKVVNE